MKKKETTRALLGLTQQEMAMLLNVSRAQWAMFESGRRNLPPDAGLRLNEMINFMLLPEGIASKSVPKTKQEDNPLKDLLERMLKETEFQLQAIARKIDTAEKKWKKHEKAVQLMVFLNSEAEVKKAAKPEILSSITTRTSRNYKESKLEWDVLQIDKDLLRLQ